MNKEIYEINDITSIDLELHNPDDSGEFTSAHWDDLDKIIFMDNFVGFVYFEDVNDVPHQF